VSTSPDTSPHTESPERKALRLRVGGGLAFMSLVHLVAPKPFYAMIPKKLGSPKFWNLVAAAAEGTAGGLLLSKDPKLQRAGGALATATIVGVYPGNIKMAIDAGPPTSPKAIAAWLRLPFQLPMIRAAASLARPEQ
jgi:uncharacterized membrane protein